MPVGIRRVNALRPMPVAGKRTRRTSGKRSGAQAHRETGSNAETTRAIGPACATRHRTDAYLPDLPVARPFCSYR